MEILTAKDIAFREKIDPFMPKERKQRVMTPEHKAKLAAARNAYWATKKEMKAAVEVKDLGVGTAYAPAPVDMQLEEVTSGKERSSVVNARERIVARINAKRDKLIDAQIDVATGLYYVANDGKHVYTKAPNAGVGEYLLNQLIGKPKESIEVTSLTLNVDI